MGAEAISPAPDALFLLTPLSPSREREDRDSGQGEGMSLRAATRPKDAASGMGPPRQTYSGPGLHRNTGRRGLARRNSAKGLPAEALAKEGGPVGERHLLYGHYGNAEPRRFRGHAQ